MKVRLVKTPFHRYYDVQNEEGKDWVKCPSVTQVISYHEDKTFLNEWKDRNPLKADVTCSSARMRGTNIHKALYCFHMDVPKYHKIVEKFSDEENKYLKGYQDLVKNTIKPLYLETPVAYLDLSEEGKGFGGKIDNVSLLKTTDFVYYKTDTKVFNTPENTFLIDYKNPNKAKKPEHLIGYCLQLSAYCAAFNFSTLLTFGLNKALLVIVSPKMTTYYYLSPEKLNVYWSLYKELLTGYYEKKKYDWKKLKESLGVHEDDRGYPRIDKVNYLPERIELKSKETLTTFEEEINYAELKF